MKIAFTHNLQLSTSEQEAEFDRPETVTAITEALRGLGHEVEPLEVSGPASRLVARLEALNPELVFNTAEGSTGRFREAFYPALFDRLGLPFTGSDAYVCALTLDKHLTKMVLAAHGVPSPRGLLVDSPASIEVGDLRFPLIVKPNYEGSSKGITADSVVEDRNALESRLMDLLSRYPSGALVEEYVEGRDLVVPFLEKASPATGGVLEPAVYEFDLDGIGPRKFSIYDYDLKSVHYDAVHVKVPAGLDAPVRERAMDLSRTVFRELGIRDLGRLDFRLGEDGTLTFLEVNALPSLEPGASIYESGAIAGLESMEAVLDLVIRSAAERCGLPLKTARAKRRRSPFKVGLTFNLRRKAVRREGDDEAEFDSPETVASIRQAIESYGHEVVELEATPELPAILPSSGVDLVFNLAEGFEGRTRESQVPALLELLGIPYTGSDPTTLALALDKGLAKRLVKQAGFLTPAFMVMVTGRERIPRDMSFPAILKPLYEGSSRGISETSVVESADELREVVQGIARQYLQAVLVEEFLPGREFTVALLGEKRPRSLPPMEVLFTDPGEKHPTYSFARKFEGAGVRFKVPADVDIALNKELQRVARGVFVALGCRDLARVDLRQDRDGRVHFIECNPLPGLSPGFSDLCIIAEAAGMTYRTLIGEILAPAIRRLREHRRRRMLEGRW